MGASPSLLKAEDKDKNAFPLGKLGPDAFTKDFDVGRTLGMGSYGRVHLCKHKKTMAWYAIKKLSKYEIVQNKQIEHVINEKAVMVMCLGHPNLVQIHGAFQDTRCVYMVLEFAQGGDVFTLLRSKQRFDLATSRYYTAQVVLGLEHLHGQMIAYRDLKPENLLFDRNGNVKITDFGFAKVVLDRTWTLCGTPEYVAPEIVRSEGYGTAVDWWAMGVLLYEFLVGWPPFFDENPMILYEKILKGRIGFPKEMDAHARHCIRQLLQADRSKRLGNMKGGVDRVKEHPFFAEIEFDKLRALELKPPHIPDIKGDNDDKYFLAVNESEGPGLESELKKIGPKDEALFKRF